MTKNERIAELESQVEALEHIVATISHRLTTLEMRTPPMTEPHTSVPFEPVKTVRITYKNVGDLVPLINFERTIP